LNTIQAAIVHVGFAIRTFRMLEERADVSPHFSMQEAPVTGVSSGTGAEILPSVLLRVYFVPSISRIMATTWAR
jgi:hypothetical protein